ncbi:hypothetical protein Srufu_001830 [Streptomyces libani subsp. rufus]|nr:hypothetical protein Srufu_001830 [Streptomyces libani subsp. rufus]
MPPAAEDAAAYGPLREGRAEVRAGAGAGDQAAAGVPPGDHLDPGDGAAEGTVRADGAGRAEDEPVAGRAGEGGLDGVGDARGFRVAPGGVLLFPQLGPAAQPEWEARGPAGLLGHGVSSCA